MGKKFLLGARQDLMKSLIYGCTTFMIPRFISDSGGFNLIPTCSSNTSIFNLVDRFVTSCKAVMFSQAFCIY